MATMAGVRALIEQDYSKYKVNGPVNITVKQSSVSDKSYFFNITVSYKQDSKGESVVESFSLQLITRNLTKQAVQ